MSVEFICKHCGSSTEIDCSRLRCHGFANGEIKVVDWKARAEKAEAELAKREKERTYRVFKVTRDNGNSFTQIEISDIEQLIQLGRRMTIDHDHIIINK